MTNHGIGNVPLKQFRTFLFNQGLSRISVSGGHEKWNRVDGDRLSRPVIIQTHLDPVPEHVVKNTLRLLGISRKQFLDLMRSL